MFPLSHSRYQLVGTLQYHNQILLHPSLKSKRFQKNKLLFLSDKILILLFLAKMVLYGYIRAFICMNEVFWKIGDE